MSERLISQLAHVELISPRPDESVKWLTEVLGLEESGRDGNSVYLRAWSEELFHSLQVTEGSQPGIGHIAWRTAGPDDVEVLAARLESAGAGEDWIEAGTGHGRAYRFRTPAGHHHEVFWEVERYSAPADLATDFPGRPQRWIPRGASPRYLDHVTVPSPDILTDAKFMVENLGLRFTDYVVPEPGAELVVFGTLTSHSTHELAYVPEFAPVRGRVNHIAFWCDQRVDVAPCCRRAAQRRNADRVRPRHPWRRRDHLPLRARARRRADRAELRRQADLSARPRDAEVASAARIQQHLSQYPACREHVRELPGDRRAGRRDAGDEPVAGA